MPSPRVEAGIIAAVFAVLGMVVTFSTEDGAERTTVAAS
jgi:hypothetical protein